MKIKYKVIIGLLIVNLCGSSLADSIETKHVNRPVVFPDPQNPYYRPYPPNYPFPNNSGIPIIIWEF